MAAQQGVQTRTPTGRQVDLHEGGQRLGYASESLRQMMFRSADPPPFRKVRGRWRAYLSELDAWAEKQGLSLMPLADDEIAQ